MFHFPVIGRGEIRDGIATVVSPDLKCDFSRDVNVKQMDLAVESHQLSYCSVNGIG